MEILKPVHRFRLVEPGVFPRSNEELMIVLHWFAELPNDVRLGCNVNFYISCICFHLKQFGEFKIGKASIHKDVIGISKYVDTIFNLIIN